MARVIGLGGIFFKSSDPATLRQWYKSHLGVPVEDWGGAAFHSSEQTARGYAIWSPFSHDSDYFAPSSGSFMINLVVDDLENALKQVQAGGATLVGEIQTSEFGQFGWFLDPDNNKIELWQPTTIPPNCDYNNES